MGRWQAIEPFLFSLYRNTKTRREPYSSREGPSQSLVVMKLSLLFMAILAFPSITLSMSLSGNESPADNEAYWLDLLNQNRFEKRKFAANDPRSLFASVYANYNGGGFRKRYNTLPDIEDYYAPQVSAKRGLRNPKDPRNLFRAIYRYKK